MVRAKDRENNTLLVDVSKAVNSAQALRILEESIANTLMTTQTLSGGAGKVDLNSGNLLLTGRVLTKINEMLRQQGAALGIVYATLPQTQQAALDCGFFVKERPLEEPLGRIRTPLDLNSSAVSTPVVGQDISSGSVDSLVERFTEQFSESFAEQFSGFSAEPRQPAKQQNQDSVGSKPPIPRSTQGAQGFQGQQEASLPFGDTMAMNPEMLSPVLNRLVVESKVEAAGRDALEKNVPPEENLPTLYWKSTLRSGQVVRYDGNLVVVGDVHGGSELSATGSILVWGELRGIAHAGVNGNRHAEIRALKIEAIQLRIADVIARRPDRIYYHKDPDDGMALPLPEVARIEAGEIKIFNDVIGK